MINLLTNPSQNEIAFLATLAHDTLYNNGCAFFGHHPGGRLNDQQVEHSLDQLHEDIRFGRGVPLNV